MPPARRSSPPAKPHAPQPAPQPSASASAPRQTNARNPFITPTDVNREGVTRVRTTGRLVLYTRQYREPPSLFLDVQIGNAKGPIRTISVRIPSQSLRSLIEQIGNDLGQWTGRTFEVHVDPTGRYVNPGATPPAKLPPNGQTDDIHQDDQDETPF